MADSDGYARTGPAPLLSRGANKKSRAKRIVGELRELRGMAADGGVLPFDFGFTALDTVEG
jgi:hypothetical protein